MTYTMEPTPRPPIHLMIFSHGHAKPLTPPGNLTYNLRKITNPPRHMLQNYDGRARRLRDHMLRDAEFVSMLERARRDVDDYLGHADTKRAAEVDRESSAARGEGGEENDGGQQIESSDNNEPVTLRLACFCAQGKHRSVAFAEELAASNWPKHYVVTLEHRDVDLAKADRGKTERRDKARWSKGSELSMVSSAECDFDE
ncbi:Hypothetical protein R9X50_00317000 [Acrodontium crateriforme]|uniref:RapZ C-terminal domain-containing protein n=1 Tax=Acrodontium crateriforme TaxID=150365 RepID=A0AAQ3R9P2_9PEZI|nr:Hypothetical protein R9X50_00317000 [Acrodontium crateriforme]